MQEYRKVLLEQLSTYGAVPAYKWSREEWHSEPGPYKKGYANSDVIGIYAILISLYIPSLVDFPLNDYLNKLIPF